MKTDLRILCRECYAVYSQQAELHSRGGKSIEFLVSQAQCGICASPNVVVGVTAEDVRKDWFEHAQSR